MTSYQDIMENTNRSLAISPKHINVLFDNDDEFGAMAGKYYNMTAAQRGEVKKALKASRDYSEVAAIMQGMDKAISNYHAKRISLQVSTAPTTFLGKLLKHPAAFFAGAANKKFEMAGQTGLKKLLEQPKAFFTGDPYRQFDIFEQSIKEEKPARVAGYVLSVPALLADAPARALLTPGKLAAATLKDTEYQLSKTLINGFDSVNHILKNSRSSSIGSVLDSVWASSKKTAPTAAEMN